jgi:hypothetical protein
VDDWDKAAWFLVGAIPRRSAPSLARMDLSSILAAIGRMPTEFRSRGDVSMVKLVSESGYVENQTLVTVDLLRR